MFGLSKKTIDDLQSIFYGYANIDKVIIFGSRAKGTYRDGSDIDFALVGNSISLSQKLDILNKAEDLDVLYKIDLIDYNKQKHTPIGDHIDRVGKCFWTRHP